jgi:rare lipoprotein A
LPRRRQASALAGLLATAALVSTACSANHRPAAPSTASGKVIARGTASWYGPKFNGRRTASGERYDMHGLTAAHPTLPFGSLVEVTNLENGHQVVVRVNDRGPFGRRRVIDLSYAAARELEMIGPGTAEVQLAIVARPEPLTPAPPAVLLASAPPPGPAAAPIAAGAPAPPTAGELPTEPDGPAAAAGAAITAATSAAERGELVSAGIRPPAPPGTRREAEAAARGNAAAARQGAALHYTVQVGAFGEPELADALQHDLARLYPDAAVHSDGIWHRVQVGLFGDREPAEQMRRELVAIGIEAVVVTAR